MFILAGMLLCTSGIAQTNPVQNSAVDTTTAEYRIVTAVISGDLVTFNTLLASNPVLINTKEQKRQESLLHVATRNNQPDMAKLLIEKGLDINAKNNLGATPLLIASLNGYVDLVKLLLSSGADLRITNNNGRSPVEYAAYGKNITVYKLFFEKDTTLVKHRSTDGATLLHWAANAGDTVLFSFLLGKGLDIQSKADDGVSVVHWAYSGGNKTMLAYLSKKGLDFNIGSTADYSPISAALYYKRKSSIEFLLENGFGINQKFQPGNNTLLIAACEANAPEVVTYLISKGADVNITNDQNLNALGLMIPNKNMEMTELLYTNGATIDPAVTSPEIRPGITALALSTLAGLPYMKWLVEKGADVNRIMSDGESALNWAVTSDSLEMVKYLVDHGAKVNLSDTSGMTILHRAIVAGNTEIVKFLVDKGADINSENKSRETPLHLASIYGRTGNVQTLVNAGAITDIKDAENKTPLYYAWFYGNKDVCHFLIQAGAKDKTIHGEPGNLSRNLPEDEAMIYFLYHSGWAVQTKNHLLVFDYIGNRKGSDNPSLLNGFINPDELQGKKVMVFASHEHDDHYDTAIWQWKDKIPDITYVMGFEPRTHNTYKQVFPHQPMIIDDVQITAIASADQGVGFMVETDGIVIYHPGDHANRQQDFSGNFKPEIDYLKKLNKSVDIAFFPVAGCGFGDPEAVMMGNIYTLETLHPKISFAMHADAITCSKVSSEMCIRVPGLHITNPINPGDRYFYANGKINFP